MEACVSFGHCTLFSDVGLILFVSSKPSINSTSSVMSPSAFAKAIQNLVLELAHLDLEARCLLILTLLFHSSPLRSARSLPSTSTFNWSLRPACVTVKLMSVVSAWISGG